jgi:hypothetical protein
VESGVCVSAVRCKAYCIHSVCVKVGRIDVSRAYNNSCLSSEDDIRECVSEGTGENDHS